MLKIKCIKPVHAISDLENDFLDIFVGDITIYIYNRTGYHFCKFSQKLFKKEMWQKYLNV